jgi:tRNA pseudouridine55 synthase
MVQTLRRTRVGPFRAEQGVSIDADPAGVQLLPMSMVVAEMTQLRLLAGEVTRFQQGQRLKVVTQIDPGTEVALLDERGQLVGIGLSEGHALKPQLVFPPL